MNKLYSNIGPTHIQYYENGSIYTEKYIEHNKLHRDIGPAFIIYYKDGSIISEGYYENDKRHRCSDIGPAYIEYYENRSVKNYAFYENAIKLDKTLDEDELENLRYSFINFKLKFSD